MLLYSALNEYYILFPEIDVVIVVNEFAYKYNVAAFKLKELENVTSVAALIVIT